MTIRTGIPPKSKDFLRDRIRVLVSDFLSTSFLDTNKVNVGGRTFVWARNFTLSDPPDATPGSLVIKSSSLTHLLRFDVATLDKINIKLQMSQTWGKFTNLCKIFYVQSFCTVYTLLMYTGEKMSITALVLSLVLFVPLLVQFNCCVHQDLTTFACFCRYTYTGKTIHFMQNFMNLKSTVCHQSLVPTQKLSAIHFTDATVFGLNATCNLWDRLQSSRLRLRNSFTHQFWTLPFDQCLIRF